MPQNALPLPQKLPGEQVASVRSKTEPAMGNEVLAKVVTHNVIVLIHEMFELGINPNFGATPQPEPDEPHEPRLLRYPGA